MPLVSAERGLFGRRPVGVGGGGFTMPGLADEIVSAIETRAIWEAGGGGPIQFTGLGARQRLQFFQRIDVERGRHADRNHRLGDARNRDQVFLVVGQLVVEVGMGGEGADRRDQQDVIVVRAEEAGDGEHAVAAGFVLDDDRLTPLGRQFIGEQTRPDIDAAAGPKRDDQAHRPEVGQASAAALGDMGGNHSASASADNAQGALLTGFLMNPPGPRRLLTIAVAASINSSSYRTDSASRHETGALCMRYGYNTRSAGPRNCLDCLRQFRQQTTRSRSCRRFCSRHSRNGHSSPPVVRWSCIGW